MSSLVLATAGYDHTIRFWEATTGICWRTIPHNDSHVNKLEISQDKKWLAAAGNPAVRVYDIQSNATAPFYTFQGHTSNVSAIGFNKEGRWLYSGMFMAGLPWWQLLVYTFPSCHYIT
jgi:target of rapamycin complex subunit LST8